MTTTNIAYGAAASLTFSGSPSLNSLPAAGLAVSSAIDNSSSLALDFLVELTIAASTLTSGNKQLLVFAASSVDNSSFSDTTYTMNLVRVGFIDASQGINWVMPLKSIAAAFGGVPPKFFKICVYNDGGVALASTGNSGRVVPITYTTA